MAGSQNNRRHHGSPVFRPIAYLRLAVVRAEGLLPADLNGLSDPYVVAEYHPNFIFEGKGASAQVIGETAPVLSQHATHSKLELQPQSGQPTRHMNPQPTQPQ